jgi:Flp pilus assembly protein TadD
VLFMAGIGEPMAEHRAYVSAMGFFVACGAMAGMAWDRAVSRGRGKLLLKVSAVAIALQFMGLTILRNEVWGSPVSLAQEAVRLSPGQWLPRLFLGESLRQTGRCAEAIPEYRAVLAQHAMTSFTSKKLLGCLLATDQKADALAFLQDLSQQDRRDLCGVPGVQCQ